MAENSQLGTPAKVGGGILVAVIVAVIAYFMQQPDDTALRAEDPAPQTAAAPQSAAEPQSAADPVAAETAAEQSPAERFAPTLEVVRVAPDGNATIAGQAEAGARVSLRVDGTEIAGADADGAGAYASLFTLPPSGDARILTIAATGSDGVEVLGTDQVILAPTVLALNEPAPEHQTTADAAAIANIADPAPEAQTADTQTADTQPIDAPVSDTQLADAQAPDTQTATNLDTPPAAIKITDSGVEVLQSAPAELADNILINSITYAEGVVSVGGLGAAGQQVRLYVDGTESGGTAIAATGTWSAQLSNIAPGVYTLRADQLDADGKVTSRYETPFKRESFETLAGETPAQPATVTVQPGMTLWAIAEQNFGKGTMYVQVFEANKSLIRDPDLIYPGQVFAIPKAE